MSHQSTLWTTMCEYTTLRYPPSDVRGQIPRESGFRKTTDAHNFLGSHPLPSPVDDFPFPLHVGVGMMKTPIPQCSPLFWGKRYLDHARVSSLLFPFRNMTLPQSVQKVSTKPVQSIVR
jgi:hypothetical protein